MKYNSYLINVPSFFNYFTFSRQKDDPIYRLSSLFLCLIALNVVADGSVWPDIRVMEALQDGLDAISLTEHLEYQLHKADIPHPDRNRSYELALREAKDHHLPIKEKLLDGIGDQRYPSNGGLNLRRASWGTQACYAGVRQGSHHRRHPERAKGQCLNNSTDVKGGRLTFPW